MYPYDVKKPALGWLGVNMEITDYMIIKGIVIVIGCIIYGFWQGFTGR